MDQRLLIGLHSDVQGLRRAAQKVRDCITGLSDCYHRARIDYYELGDEYELARFEAQEDFENCYAAELRDIHLALLDLHDRAAEGGAIRNVLDAEWRKLDDPLSNCDRAVGRVTGITEYVAREARLGRMNSLTRWNECDEQLANSLHLIDGALARIEAIPTVDEHLSRESIAWLRGQASVDVPARVENATIATVLPEGAISPNASANGAEREAAVDGPNDAAVDQPQGNGEAEPQLAASANGADLSTPLKGKYVKALDFIKSRPNQKALVIAKHIDVSESHFRKVYLPVLRPHGVYNDRDGYYWKPIDGSSTEPPPSAT
jgi:hypothetical protein